MPKAFSLVDEVIRWLSRKVPIREAIRRACTVAIHKSKAADVITVMALSLPAESKIKCYR